MPKWTYAAFLTSDSYLPGAIALAKSLKNAECRMPLTIFVPEGEDGTAMLEALPPDISMEYIKRIVPPDSIKRANERSGFSRWNETFTKISVFAQTQYDKIVLLDADMMVAKNIDHLFELPNMSAVAAGKKANPSWINPNGGLLVVEPSKELFGKMLSRLEKTTSEELGPNCGMGDQDLLHITFPEWPSSASLHLPETYNMLTHYMPKYMRDRTIRYKDIAVFHYARSPKPWDFTARDWARALLRAFHYGSLSEIRALRDYRALLK